ncbi:histone-lysine N-methyltransferase SETMAR [Trichonephila clavipes]|nr:histone-lysine N-methyltransferase SETMAR [Trichonephila clavipes]
MGYDSVQRIVSDVLRYSKASVRWDPHALSNEQKATRMFAKCQRQNGNAEEMFQRCHSDGQHFIDHVVTGDETWLHHFVTTSKKATIEWKHPGSPRKKYNNKKYKVTPCAGIVQKSMRSNRLS